MARAAFSSFDASTNRTSGASLDENFRPEVDLKFKAARYFRKIVAEATVGHFLTTDAPLLVQYCVLLAKLDAYQNEFNEAKSTVTTRLGDIRPNPVVVIYTKLQQQATTLATKLRLQPMSRSKAAVHGESRKPPKEEDDQEETPPQDDQAPSRLDLMFGGTRLAEALGVTKEDDY